MTRTLSLEQVRAATYKRRDSWWTVWLVDPLASRLVRAVAPLDWVTPNRLTLGAFVIGLGSAASFLQADRAWLALGALLFHLSFVLDCMDGKIARLKGTGSVFGSWLDYVFDRLRVLVCGAALMGGQYLATGETRYLWLVSVVLFVDMLRYLNALQMAQMRDSMRSALEAAQRRRAAGAAAPSSDVYDDVRARFGRFSSARAFLVRHRIRPHVFGGIEFQMFVFIIGPLTGAIVVVTVASAALVLLFELLLVVYIYAATQSHERAMAAALTDPDC